MRIAVLFAVAGCYAGNYQNVTGEFVGTRSTIGCLDVAVTLTDDDLAPRPIIAYQFGNSCMHETIVDFTAVHVLAVNADGRRIALAPYDPRHELRPMQLDAWTSGDERIAYQSTDLAAPPTTVCVDLGRIDARPANAAELDMSRRRWRSAMKALLVIAFVGAAAPRAHAKGCHETSNVVGYEHCSRFGSWSRDQDVFPFQPRASAGSTRASRRGRSRSPTSGRARCERWRLVVRHGRRRRCRAMARRHAVDLRRTRDGHERAHRATAVSRPARRRRIVVVPRRVRRCTCRCGGSRSVPRSPPAHASRSTRTAATASHARSRTPKPPACSTRACASRCSRRSTGRSASCTATACSNSDAQSFIVYTGIHFRALDGMY